MELLNLIKCQLKLDFRRMLNYKISLISDISIFAVVIVSTFLTGLDVAFARGFEIDIISGKMLVLIGFIFWQISSTALGWSAANIRNETVLGTFELKMQSKFPISLMLFFQMLTYVIMSFVVLSIMFIIFILVVGGNIIEVLYIPLSYLVAFPAVLGMYGIGLIIGGISLREKQTGNLTFILQSALIFVSDFINVKSRIFNIIPFNAGIKIMRNLYLGNPVEPTLVADYILINIFWLIFGLAIFKVFLKKERKNGSFDSY